MSRFARQRRVFFFEEPVFEKIDAPELRNYVCPKSGVRVLTPALPEGTRPDQNVHAQRMMAQDLLRNEAIEDFVAWYYTPMALEFTRNLRPDVTVYDCMDELSAFAGAPPALRANEQELLRKADLVFTGGASLYEAKRSKHSSVHKFPSSVDVAHFARALAITREPEDQRAIPHPRIGYVGVIDERMDLDLITSLTHNKPEWQIVMIGPVVKISPHTLPRANNIHYLGMKSYEELPAYLSGWDVAMLPFARNESTRFISPTKTPEYLAAGLPVVSTPIRDVAKPYGELGLVSIAGTAEEYIAAIERLLRSGHDLGWQADVKAFLDQLSWERTWTGMKDLIQEKLAAKSAPLGRNVLAAKAGAANV